MRSNSKERRYTSAVDRAHKAEKGSGSSYVKLPEGFEWFKPKSGTMLLDIIPFEVGKNNPWAEPGSLHYERTIFIHRGVGPNNDFVLCPAKTSKKQCPICEHRAKLMKKDDKNEEAEQLIQDLGPKQRQLFNLRNRKEPDKKYVWDISYHLFGKVLDARLRAGDEEDDWGKFFFIEDGLTLRVNFAERSFGGATFNETESIDFKARSSQYEEDILEEVVKFDESLVEMPYDKLKALFLQTGEDEEADDDDAPPKKKKVVEDDDDDDDVPAPKKKRDEVDEEDDVPAPKKRVVEDDDDEPPKKKKPVADDDDADWDLDDEPKKKKPVADDDDEEPAPKKKKPVVEDDDDEEEEKPHIKARPLKEEDDEDVPKKKKPVDDDDDDEPAPKKKKPVDDDDGWDDGPPKKKKKPADVEDDD